MAPCTLQYRLILLFSLHIIATNAVSMYFDCRSQRCRLRSMICEDNTDCVIDCSYDTGDTNPWNDEACLNSVVVCGANAKCEVLCDGNQGCHTLRVDATRATELIIKCNDHQFSCYYANIFCPITGECNIIADNTNTDVLQYAKLYSANGLSNIHLNTSISLQSNITIYCGEQYTHECYVENTAPHAVCQSSDDMSCSSPSLNVMIDTIQTGSDFDCRTKQCRYLLLCANNTDCTLDCSYNEYACLYSFVICPNGAKCSLFCDGDSACVGMYVYASESAELNIMCGSFFGSCNHLVIVCPHSSESKKCHITGYNDIYNVFLNMEIYALNGYNDVVFTNSSMLETDIVCGAGPDYDSVWNLHNIFDCHSTKRCGGMRTLICHNESDCSIDCSYSYRACRFSVIHCPQNHKCNIYCNGTESCDFATIYASKSTELDILCADYFATCRETDIYCPSALCSITGYNDDEQQFGNMEIFAVNGVNDFSLSLMKNRSLHNNITVNCGTNYAYWCRLEQTAPFNRCKIGFGDDEFCNHPFLTTSFTSTETTINPFSITTSLPSDISTTLTTLSNPDIDATNNITNTVAASLSRMTTETKTDYSVTYTEATINAILTTLSNADANQISTTETDYVTVSSTKETLFPIETTTVSNADETNTVISYQDTIASTTTFIPIFDVDQENPDAPSQSFLTVSILVIVIAALVFCIVLVAICIYCLRNKHPVHKDQKPPPIQKVSTMSLFGDIVINKTNPQIIPPAVEVETNVNVELAHNQSISRGNDNMITPGVVMDPDMDMDMQYAICAQCGVKSNEISEGVFVCNLCNFIEDNLVDGIVVGTLSEGADTKGESATEGMDAFHPSDFEQETVTGGQTMM